MSSDSNPSIHSLCGVRNLDADLLGASNAAYLVAFLTKTVWESIHFCSLNLWLVRPPRGLGFRRPLSDESIASARRQAALFKGQALQHFAELQEGADDLRAQYLPAKLELARLHLDAVRVGPIITDSAHESAWSYRQSLQSHLWTAALACTSPQEAEDLKAATSLSSIRRRFFRIARRSGRRKGLPGDGDLGPKEWGRLGVEILVRIKKEVAAAQERRQTPSGCDAPRWSVSNGVQYWARVYGLSRNAMSEKLRDQSIRNKKLGAKNYLIAMDDLPERERVKYSPPKG
jgi:hypothetical protein